MSIRMAQRYEKAWHKLYYESPRWKQEMIIEDPHSRMADELAKEAASLAEKDNEAIIVPTGCNK